MLWWSTNCSEGRPFARPLTLVHDPAQLQAGRVPALLDRRLAATAHERRPSSGCDRPKKAKFCGRRNTPPCRHTSASHSPSRPVQPGAPSEESRSPRLRISAAALSGLRSLRSASMPLRGDLGIRGSGSGDPGSGIRVDPGIRGIRDPGNRSVNPVWTWERANRTLALSTASTGRMSLRRRAPDRIGSLCDDACPTAGTPDTGLAERLRIRVTVR